MSSFDYTIRDARGALHEGTVEAESLESAMQALRREGHQVLELAEADVAALLPCPVRQDEIIYTTSQLAIMIDTGIGLATALEGLADQTENRRLREVLQKVRRDVEGGRDFSASLADFPKYFDRTYVALVRASERSGTLGMMLEEIAGYMTRQLEHRRKVRAAMAYPAFMLLLAICVTVFLLTYILPKFEPLFARQGLQLPAPTQLVIGLSNSLTQYWAIWVSALVALTGGLFAGRATAQGRVILDHAKLHLPLIGATLRKVALSRSIRTLGVMIKHNVPVLEALQLCSDVSNNVLFERVWTQVIDEVTRGQRISESLSTHPLIPCTLVQMIRSGEETGKLDYVLEKVSRFYDREVESALKTTASLIEPLLITVMGAVVGGIGMAVMLPIFTLSRSAG